eukprot:1351004-Amorphochlora_amoeboformis.AAC.1
MGSVTGHVSSCRCGTPHIHTHPEHNGRRHARSAETGDRRIFRMWRLANELSIWSGQGHAEGGGGSALRAHWGTIPYSGKRAMWLGVFGFIFFDFFAPKSERKVAINLVFWGLNIMENKRLLSYAVPEKN